MPASPPPGGVAPAQPVDVKLLELLVCPLTRTTLEYAAGTNELIARAARLAFPVRDGIPIMLVSEARQLSDDEMPRRD